jgi:hypothetical protein
MRFDGGINLLFHFGVVLVSWKQIWLEILIFSGGKLDFAGNQIEAAMVFALSDLVTVRVHNDVRNPYGGGSPSLNLSGTLRSLAYARAPEGEGASEWPNGAVGFIDWLDRKGLR